MDDSPRIAFGHGMGICASHVSCFQLSDSSRSVGGTRTRYVKKDRVDDADLRSTRSDQQPRIAVWAATPTIGDEVRSGQQPRAALIGSVDSHIGMRCQTVSYGKMAVPDRFTRNKSSLSGGFGLATHHITPVKFPIRHVPPVGAPRATVPPCGSRSGHWRASSGRRFRERKLFLSGVVPCSKRLGLGDSV